VFGQLVSHCLTIKELIPAKGMLLNEIKKRGKRVNIGELNHSSNFTLSIHHQAGIGSSEDQKLVNMSFKYLATVSLNQSEVFL
jgi:hypothetical protein